MITKKEVRAWDGEIDAVGDLIGRRFVRSEPRTRVRQFLGGLIGDAKRKNGWQLAENIGEHTPYNIQHFISRARWDADLVRDDLIRYVDRHLGKEDGVLILDETGFLKKGDKSVGVMRQYSGTGNGVENCQVGVFLAYKSSLGHALIDRAIYMPKEWLDDPARRREAKVPDHILFATKPELGLRALAHAVEIGIKAKWAAADQIYGNDHRIRRYCESVELSYVFSVASRICVELGDERMKVDKFAERFTRRDFRILSCGKGCKGERKYRWAFVSAPCPQHDGYCRGVLVRRRISGDPETTYYFTYARKGTSLKTLVRIAGSRWAIEECFEQAKQEAGLDEYEVRNWHAWHRHITLSMFAHAALSVIRAKATSEKKTPAT